jgi:iron complex transport system permease protein
MQNIGISDLLGGADENIIRIMWDLRVPRVLLGWITGSTLALCGLIFQALFRNPLASPDMLGVSTGAAFGAVVYIRTGIVFSLFGAVSGLSLAAFSGALAATFAIYAAGNLRRGGMSEATLLLAGVAMSFLFGSLNMIIQFTGGYIDTFRMMRWSMGGIQAVGFGPVLATLPALAVIFAVAFVTAPELNLFVCGEDIAASRGVSVVRLRRLLFFSVSIVIGINVATCGPIGFVGLLGPHICRKFVGTDHRKLALASLFFGGAFLVLCDTAARILWSPAEVPVGVLTSFIGSIFFLWLLVRGRR